MMNVVIIDEFGNAKTVPFTGAYARDEEYPEGLGDFLATHTHPCSGCATVVLYDASVTVDGEWYCKDCGEKQ